MSHSFIKFVRIFLLVLIVIGIGLIATQKSWVPELVNKILSSDPNFNKILPPVVLLPIKPVVPPVVRDGKVDTGVEGIATIGPTCPVERIPPDPACADKPFKTNLVIASTLPGRGTGILITTDANGYFSHALSPGTYTISAPGGETSLPRLTPIKFTVTLHNVVSLNLQFDSGIR